MGQGQSQMAAAKPVYTKQHGRKYLNVYVMYHSTDASNVDSILTNGFQVRPTYCSCVKIVGIE